MRRRTEKNPQYFGPVAGSEQTYEGIYKVAVMGKGEDD